MVYVDICVPTCFLLQYGLVENLNYNAIQVTDFKEA